MGGGRSYTGWWEGLQWVVGGATMVGGEVSGGRSYSG